LFAVTVADGVIVAILPFRSVVVVTPEDGLSVTDGYDHKYVAPERVGKNEIPVERFVPFPELYEALAADPATEATNAGVAGYPPL